MPFKSESQRRLFYAAASGKAKKGPSKEVAKKFIRDAGESRHGKLRQLARKRKK